MTYFEVSKDILGGLGVRQLDCEEVIEGKVDGSPTALKVLTDTMILKRGRLQFGPDGATVFDKPGWFSPRKAVAYLTSEETKDIEWDHATTEKFRLPGIFQNILQGLYRRAHEQAGLRKRGQRSFFERLEAEMSLGLTEIF